MIECRRRLGWYDLNPEVQPTSFASLFRRLSSRGHLQIGHILGSCPAFTHPVFDMWSGKSISGASVFGRAGIFKLTDYAKNYANSGSEAGRVNKKVEP